MNKKALVVLVLALILGAITAVSVNTMLKRQARGAGSDQLKKVVVAVAMIPIGSQIRVDQIRVEEWPKAPDGSFDEAAKVVNRVAQREITIGEPILASGLAAEGSGAGLSAIIPAGMRAMTVKVDEVIGVAGFVRAGTYVDVVATAVRGVEGESASRIILQNVKVLASGKEIEKRADGGAVEVNTVTLQVTPDQAELLALASNAGKLQLVMRNATDQEPVETPGADTQAVFGGARRAVAVAAPPRPAGEEVARKKTPPPTEPPPPKQTVTVEMIKGAERGNVTFEKPGSQD
jgi:pilus assembly protein CpaB